MQIHNRRREVKEEKPVVRCFEAVMIEISSDGSSWDGEYRATLDFYQPWGSEKRQKIFRIHASPVELVYMKERIDAALDMLRDRFAKDCGDDNQ